VLLLRVLCIDDNHDVADSTADLLQFAGFEARACYSGASALSEAATFLPGLCLIDLNMPGMDGDVLAVRLREQAGTRTMVLIAVTAMGNEESSRRIRDAGFDMHLIKPVYPVALLRIVERPWQWWQSARSSRPGDPSADRIEDGGKNATNVSKPQPRPVQSPARTDPAPSGGSPGRHA
jgi:DNA-binding response OmpR family regulator